MCSLLARLRGLPSDRRGVTAVEFAIILMPLFMLILGSLDLGYQMYLRAMTAGALERAARQGAIGNRSSAQITQLIKSQISSVLPAANGNNVTVTPLNYFNFSSIGHGERITNDTIPLGRYNSTDCYEDRNNNFKYDATSSASEAAGLGGADDITYYQVKVSVPRLFPIASYIGWSDRAEVNVRTLIRNQPYGNQSVIVRCS